MFNSYLEKSNVDRTQIVTTAYNCCSTLSYRYLIAPAFPMTTVRSAGSVKDGRYIYPCLPHVELNDSGLLKINQIYLFYS